MTSWLESKAPTRFEHLLTSSSIKDTLSTASTGTNPPHLLLSGPSGVGKTAVMRMLARQLLGPGWQSTTHILNAKDLSRMPGAMKIFEEFIRPSGSSNSLAGLTSLDIFTDSLAEVPNDPGPPSGHETFNNNSDGRIKLSRIIVIEDAAHSVALTVDKTGDEFKKQINLALGRPVNPEEDPSSDQYKDLQI